MEKMLSDVAQMVKTIVQGMVRHPEAVALEEARGAYTVVLELRVAPEDQGKIIGRQGRTVNALRELLCNVGARANRRYLLNVLGHASLERLATPLLRVDPTVQKVELEARTTRGVPRTDPAPARPARVLSRPASTMVRTQSDEQSQSPVRLFTTVVTKRTLRDESRSTSRRKAA